MAINAIIYVIVKFLAEQLFYVVWEIVTRLHYILLLVGFVIPLFVGLVVLYVALFFRLTTPKEVYQREQTKTPCPSISFSPFSPQTGSAFLLQFVRSQKNEYQFQSISGLPGFADLHSTRMLKTVLNDYFKPYTMMAVERVLVIVPNLESLIPLVKMPTINSYTPMHHGQPVPFQKSFLSTEKTLASAKGCDTRAENLSMDRLAYMDFSLRKYYSSPRNLYKEKRPIHFKFLSDA